MRLLIMSRVSDVLFLTCFGLAIHNAHAVALYGAICDRGGFFNESASLGGDGMTCGPTVNVFFGDYMNHTSFTDEECGMMVGPEGDQIPLTAGLTYLAMRCCTVPPGNEGMCGPYFNSAMICEDEAAFNPGAMLPFAHCEGDEAIEDRERCITVGEAAWVDDEDESCDVGRLPQEEQPTACRALGGTWANHSCWEFAVEAEQRAMQEDCTCGAHCADIQYYAGMYCCNAPGARPGGACTDEPDHEDDDHEDDAPSTGGTCSPISSDTVDRMRGWGYEPVFCASAR